MPFVDDGVLLAVVPPRARLITRNGVELDHILRCPTCLRATPAPAGDRDRLACASCGASFGFKGQVPILLDRRFSADLLARLEETRSWEDYDADRVETRVAVRSASAPTIWQRLSPSFRAQVGPTYREFIDRHGVSGRILELGGGPNGLRVPGAVNVDVNDYSTVDVIGDARRLPFDDDTFQAIISNSVLEHIWDVELVAEECHRVVAPGGLVFICVPQVCGRHHTYDYRRWTVPGLSRLFHRFAILDSGTVLGPGMFLNHLAGSIVTAACGDNVASRVVRLILDWLLLPVRLLDFVGRGSEAQTSNAHTIYIIGRKQDVR